MQETDNAVQLRSNLFWLAQKRGDDNLPVADLVVSDTPEVLPEGYSWVDIDTDERKTAVVALLQSNYIKNERFHLEYPEATIRSWIDAAEIASVACNGVVVGCVMAQIDTVAIKGVKVPMALVDFLCVHSDHRDAGFALHLVREMMRKCAKQKIGSAYYTSAHTLPNPVSFFTYFHRCINAERALDARFYELPANISERQFRNAVKLPKQLKSTGLIQLDVKDRAWAAEFMNRCYSTRHIAPVFNTGMLESTPHVRHVLRYGDSAVAIAYRADIVFQTGKRVKQAMIQYIAAENESTESTVLGKLLVYLQDKGYDVVTTLDNVVQKDLLNSAGFQKGTGRLGAYLYNWQAPLLRPNDIAMSLE